MVIRELYLTVMKTFSQTLAKGNTDMQKKRLNLSLQQKFIDNLVKLVKTVLREGGNRKKKAEKLQQLLGDPTIFKFNFGNFEPIPFPLDPDVTIKGIIAEKASLFKSALMPSKLHFITTDNTEYVAIFKHGDDLRQDQLILQMITLMDKLLRKENLDLKLTPYKVLATSTRHGFVQFIDSVSVAEAVNAEGKLKIGNALIRVDIGGFGEVIKRHHGGHHTGIPEKHNFLNVAFSNILLFIKIL